MRIIAHDPFISEDVAADLGVDLDEQAAKKYPPVDEPLDEVARRRLAFHELHHRAIAACGATPTSCGCGRRR